MTCLTVGSVGQNPVVGCGPAVVGCPQWVAVGKMREEGDEERRSQKP